MMAANRIMTGVTNHWGLRGRCPARRLGYLFSVSIFALLIALGWTNQAHAAPGDLDTSFSGDGKASAEVGENSRAHATAVQPDGKIVVAGSYYNIAECDPQCIMVFSLARFNSDGTLDQSFGTGGKVTMSNFMTPSDVAVQPDGKIVLAGYGPGPGYGMALARFNSGGTLDESFGTGGRVVTILGTSTSYPSSASSLALLPDGKILAAGHTAGASGDFALARYNANGTLDTNADADPTVHFDTNGIATTDFGGTTARAGASGIAVQSDQKIVLAGSRTDDVQYESDFALARYNADGTPDLSFSTDGKLTSNFSSSDPTEFATGVALQDDKIVVVGMKGLLQGQGDFVLARYNQDGAVDSTFGTGGRVFTDFNSPDDFARDLAIQSNGKIVAVGGTGDYYADRTGKTNFAVARYAPNGALDSGFGNGGKVVTNLSVDSSGESSQDEATAVAIQPNGRIVVAGETSPDFDSSAFAVVRYQGDTVTSHPTVIDTTPDAGATQVLRDISPTATFSEEMNSNTITSTTVKLQMYNKKKGRWMTIPATVTPSVVNNKTMVTLDPYGATEPTGAESPLAANKKFRGLVTTGAKDLSGNPLARNFVWTFTTGTT